MSRHRTTEGLRRQRAVALFVAGWLLLNFPLLALWDRDATLAGLPLFPAMLFGLWAALVAALAWLMESGWTSGVDPGRESDRDSVREP